MNNDDMKSLGFAWAGTGSTWILVQQAQVWAALIAGVLTSAYTLLKIYDWIVKKRKGRK